MDKFEEKVLNAVDKLESEGKIVGLEDPMAFDTEEGLKKKEAIWKEIFLRCPDFANYIIEMYDAGGELAITTLHDYLGEFSDINPESSEE